MSHRYYRSTPFPKFPTLHVRAERPRLLPESHRQSLIGFTLRIGPHRSPFTSAAAPLAYHRAVIDRATRDAIAANTSIEQHDARLREMELTWCRKKPSLFPSHIRTTFATVRSRLEARDAKQAGQVRTATRYELADFDGIRKGEDEERRREERGKVGNEGEKGKEEKERAREEGDGRMVNVPGDANDVVVTSRSAGCLHSTTTNVGPPNLPTTTTSQTNCVPFAKTQTDANRGGNEVEETRERGTRNVRTAPGDSATTPPTRSPTANHCPALPKPSVVPPEDRVANPTANKGV